MLTGPEKREVRKQEQAVSGGGDVDAIAFFPLTLPFTTGPGTISVAVALGADRPAWGVGLIGFFLGMSLAASAIAALVWVCYRFADRIAGLMSASTRKTISRLMAFLLLCIGTQMMIGGTEGAVRDILHGLGR